MHTTRKIIRAFLASPGDLQEERKSIRDVVGEFNESWADELGYQVELVGWEETIAGFGRPQHLINQDLDRCDLFIGMIWKRWGTPPDQGRGFSSGFEEEFERSVARHEEHGSPEISLFFKQVPEQFMEDPGTDLKKVIEFREKIIAGKKILFKEFTTPSDLESLVRKCVTAYVNRVRAEDEPSEPDEPREKRARSSIGETNDDASGRESSPLSAEGFRFLESLVERIRQPDSLEALTATDVARFRLLADSISKRGNDEMNLGVHDINILFAARADRAMKLGKIETKQLVRLGFQHLANENVPLWCWYSDLADFGHDSAIVSAVVGANESERAGAISVLTALGLDLSADDHTIERDEIMEVWFSDESSVKVRTAALTYLAQLGTIDDFEVAKKEYARNDYGTSRNALECMVAILIRTCQMGAAEKLVIESQFESLDVGLLESVLGGFADLDTPSLLIGLEHRNPKVRLRAMEILHGQRALDISQAERLSEDGDAQVRNEAIAVLRDLGKQFSEEEVKEILVAPEERTRPGLLGSQSVAGTGKTGKELFRLYLLDEFGRLSESELEKRVEANLVFEHAVYFALVEKHFRNYGDTLRRDVDDRFGAYFDERLQRMRSSFSDVPATQRLIKKTRDIKHLVCKDLTRQGLDVLCAAQDPKDLHRIRTNLRDGYTGASKLDAQYLGRHGEWGDISILANADQRVSDSEFQSEVARAVTSIGRKHSISDLLSLEMPAAILRMTIDLCVESRFATISRDTLFALFKHDSEKVRKAAAVLAVRALPIKRIRALLREYVASDGRRYYNVIHWLDLGVSMRRDDAKKVARAASNPEALSGRA